MNIWNMMEILAFDNIQVMEFMEQEDSQKMVREIRQK